MGGRAGRRRARGRRRGGRPRRFAPPAPARLVEGGAGGGAVPAEDADVVEQRLVVVLERHDVVATAVDDQPGGVRAGAQGVRVTTRPATPIPRSSRRTPRISPPSRAMAPPAGRPAAAKRRTASSSASGSTSDSTRWRQDFDGGTSRPVAGLRNARAAANWPRVAGCCRNFVLAGRVRRSSVVPSWRDGSDAAALALTRMPMRGSHRPPRAALPQAWEWTPPRRPCPPPTLPPRCRAAARAPCSRRPAARPSGSR